MSQRDTRPCAICGWPDGTEHDQLPHGYQPEEPMQQLSEPFLKVYDTYWLRDGLWDHQPMCPYEPVYIPLANVRCVKKLVSDAVKIETCDRSGGSRDYYAPGSLEEWFGA